MWCLTNEAVDTMWGAWGAMHLWGVRALSHGHFPVPLSS